MIFRIRAPGYRKDSAGARVLHQLCHVLNKKGCRAFLPADIEASPNLLTPRWDSIGRPDIAVYPEGIKGNPYGARKVVRWLLGTSAFHGEPGDLIFVWEPWCNPPGMSYPQLWFPMVDRSVFFDKGSARFRRLVYARKFLLAGGELLPEHRNLPNLAEDVPPGSWKALAMLLRTAQELIVYERTMLTTEAALCGCPSLPAIAGLGLGSMDEEMDDYADLERRSDTMVDGFIKACLI